MAKLRNLHSTSWCDDNRTRAMLLCNDFEEVELIMACDVRIYGPSAAIIACKQGDNMAKTHKKCTFDKEPSFYCCCAFCYCSSRKKQSFGRYASSMVQGKISLLLRMAVRGVVDEGGREMERKAKYTPTTAATTTSAQIAFERITLPLLHSPNCPHTQ